MKKMSKFIVKHYKLIFSLFLILTILSAVLALGVKQNFSLAKYMPRNSESMTAIDKMKEEFDEPIPNLRAVIKDVSIPEVLEYKEKLKEIPEVKLVLWMDILTNPSQPIEIIDKDLLDTYYIDNNALLQISVETDNAAKSLEKIKEILPEDTAYDGEIVSESAAQSAVTSEIATITALAVPAGILILIFSVRSWIEPVLLMLTIGVAIVINMGTNIFLGEISFVTQSVSGILQLAVSLDYAIFLLHEYHRQKNLQKGDKEALVDAIKISASSVISSALTTVFGFLALVFMKFGIGKDLGLVLAKGVFFSLVSVIMFLPALIIMTKKWIEKTEHRDFLPNFKILSKGVYRFRIIAFIILAIVPISFVAQKRNNFTYGMGDYAAGSLEEKDQKYIESIFGKNNQIVLLVKRGDLAKEDEMISELKRNPFVKSVQSYTEQLGTSLPMGIPPKEEIKSIISDNYSRIILNTKAEKEGPVTFEYINQIKYIARKYYQDDFELIGESVVLEDMSKIVQKDNRLVNILAIISVGLIIMLNFKSLSIPFILVLVIESSIWINLAIPYYKGAELSFIGYLIISSIQLGATVDYAILYTNEYLYARRTMDKKEAVIQTGMKVYKTIIPPALILMTSGIILSIVSSISLVSELGTVLGRGAFLSLLLVVLVLPVMLYYLDWLVMKTTMKSKLSKG